MNQTDKDALIDIVIDAMADLVEAETALQLARNRLTKLSSLLDRSG